MRRSSASKGKKPNLLIIAGLLFISAGLLLTAYNMWIQARAARLSADILNKLLAQIDDSLDAEYYSMDPDADMPVVIVDGKAYVGVIKIPEIDIELPVLSEWSYPNLLLAPCRYCGTPYLDNFVLAAHNYDSHFGKLKYLGPGDAVTFKDVLGREFKYSVAEVEILEPTAIEEMKESDYPLTLFTCTIGGAARVTVRCDRMTE